MGQAHGTYSGEDRCMQCFVGKQEEKRHLEDLSVEESLVLKWIFEKWDEAHGLDLSGFE
jgi:hypothetical protein